MGNKMGMSPKALCPVLPAVLHGRR